MARFAANISTMFTEVPFLQPFTQAAETGFNAVEFQYAFEFSAGELATHTSAAGVSVELINAPPGESSTGAMEQAAIAGAEQAVHYSVD